MLTDEEITQLTEFVRQANNLGLSEKDFATLRHFLELIRAWQLRAKLVRKKAECERLYGS